ncbi:MAG TPA: CNNM domain-containing protein [Prosthecobacter sp.]|nr:CNNM domain-containing protein [Prosthecobacter sp.]
MIFHLDPSDRFRETVRFVALLILALVYLALLLLLAVLSATETAIHSARDLEPRLDTAMAGGVARKLRSITANPFAQLHRTLLLSATLNLALAALGLHLITGPFRAFGWNPWVSGGLLFVATVLIGDVVPKFLAARAPSPVLLGSLRLLTPLHVVLDPLSTLADRATDALIHRFISSRLKTRVPMTRDEFETLVEMREEQGLLEAAEASMIREVLDIERLTVRDCMVPRMDLTLMSAEERPEKIGSLLEQTPSRFVVVYGETPDMVEGVVDTQAWKVAGRPPWKTVMQSVAFVPETMPVLEALDQHLRETQFPVLIVDEYGGLEGMLSQEEIADWVLYEAAPWQGEEAEIRELGGGRYLVDGGTRIDDVAEALGISLPSAGLDSIGGLVFNQLGHVPKAGERIQMENVEIKVRRVVRARVQQLELRVKTPPPEEETA